MTQYPPLQIQTMGLTWQASLARICANFSGGTSSAHYGCRFTILQASVILIFRYCEVSVIYEGSTRTFARGSEMLVSVRPQRWKIWNS